MALTSLWKKEKTFLNSRKKKNHSQTIYTNLWVGPRPLGHGTSTAAVPEQGMKAGGVAYFKSKLPIKLPRKLPREVPKAR